MMTLEALTAYTLLRIYFLSLPPYITIVNLSRCDFVMNVVEVMPRTISEAMRLKTKFHWKSIAYNRRRVYTGSTAC